MLGVLNIENSKSYISYWRNSFFVTHEPNLNQMVTDKSKNAKWMKLAAVDREALRLDLKNVPELHFVISRRCEFRG